MVATHTIKYHGTWYRAGEEIPSEPVVEKKVEVQTVDEPKTYTKTDIARMNAGELREIMTGYGLENAEEYTRKELQEKLIETLNL